MWTKATYAVTLMLYVIWGLYVAPLNLELRNSETAVLVSRSADWLKHWPAISLRFAPLICRYNLAPLIVPNVNRATVVQRKRVKSVLSHRRYWSVPTGTQFPCRCRGWAEGDAGGASIIIGGGVRHHWEMLCGVVECVPNSSQLSVPKT